MNHVLTQRDRAILSDLWLYRYLDSRQVTRLHFTNPQTARRRLRRLLGSNLIERFRPSTLVQTGFGRWTYRLTMAGARVVAEATGVSAKGLRRPPRGAPGGRYLAHHALLTDFRIWLREACAGSAGLFGYEFIPAYEEVRDGPRRARRIALGLSGDRSLIPDGVFSLVRRDGRAALFTLEVDRGTEPLTGRHDNAITRKLARYSEAFESVADRTYSELFGRTFTGFRVLCLVPGEKRQGAFLRIAEEAGLQPLVWIAPVDIVQSPGRLDDRLWRERREGELLPLSL